MSFDGTNYLVAWNDSRLDPGGGYYDIFGARVDPITETVIDSSAFSISTATGQQGSSALAWNGTQYLAVWQGDERDDHYKISGARVESDASILAPGDFPVFPTTMGPALEIGDVRIVEGNAGTSQIAQIPLTLSEPATSAVTAMYTLTGDTAQFASDWRPTTRLPQGTVTFPIGAVVKYVQVKIIGDSDTDGERTLHATVSNVSGAHLAGDDTGAVTILDDDATPANGISIGDVVIAEGDALTRPAKLPITLSAPAATDMTITLTRSGTAVRLTDDKMPAVKRVLVRAGHSSALVAVPILGDRLREQDETLYFEASATGMPFAARIGSVLIRDEASDAGPVVASAPAGDAFYTPPTVPKGPPGELVWSRVTATTGLATQHLVMYRSTSQRRMPTFVTARVWVPNGLVPGTGRDVVAWADGATGLGDECAPSRIPNGVAALTELLTAGNVVVATDYEGSGTPGAHAFLMARSEAQTIFDSIRTVAELGVPTSGRAVLLGASRGGHAVIAAAERRGYAPETDVLGAITLGPGVITPDDDGLINGSLTSDGKGYTMMSMRAMQQIYGPKASAVQSYLSYYLTSAGIADLPAADSCATAISHFAPVAGASIFNLTRGPIPAAADTLRQELTIGALGTSVPIMVMYGGADNLVPKAAIEDWLAFACGQSGPIDTHYYQFDGHVPVHPSDIAAWIAARFAGSPPGDACP
jgi:hypothetical protein